MTIPTVKVLCLVAFRKSSAIRGKPFRKSQRITQPDRAVVIGSDGFEFQGDGPAVHRQSIEGGGHAFAAIDAGADQDAHLVEQSGVEKSAVDGASADYGHAFHAEFLVENLAGACQVDAVASRGDPRDVA